MKKKTPTFKSDREAEKFIAEADLSEYDLSGAQLTRFEMKRKEESAPTSGKRLAGYTLQRQNVYDKKE